jgi:hypothetical protein
MSPGKKVQISADVEQIPTVQVTDPDSDVEEVDERGQSMREDVQPELREEQLNDDFGDGEDDPPIEPDDDGAEPPDVDNQSPVLTRTQEVAQAMADIKKNWGEEFSSLRACIPEGTWIKGSSKDMTEHHCNIDIIRSMRRLSDQTKGQGLEIKDQIDLFWKRRHHDGKIGRTPEGKETNLREDLEKLRKGEREQPRKGEIEKPKGAKKRRQAAVDNGEPSVPNKRSTRSRAPDYKDMEDPKAPEDDGDESSSGPDEIPPDDPVSKRSKKGKEPMTKAPRAGGVVATPSQAGPSNSNRGARPPANVEPSSAIPSFLGHQQPTQAPTSPANAPIPRPQLTTGNRDVLIRLRSDLTNATTRLEQARAVEEDYGAEMRLIQTRYEGAVVRTENARRDVERRQEEVRQAEQAIRDRENRDRSGRNLEDRGAGPKGGSS